MRIYCCVHLCICIDFAIICYCLHILMAAAKGGPKRGKFSNEGRTHSCASVVVCVFVFVLHLLVFAIVWAFVFFTVCVLVVSTVSECHLIGSSRL